MSKINKYNEFINNEDYIKYMEKQSGKFYFRTSTGLVMWRYRR